MHWQSKGGLPANKFFCSPFLQLWIYHHAISLQFSFVYITNTFSIISKCSALWKAFAQQQQRQQQKHSIILALKKHFWVEKLETAATKIKNNNQIATANNHQHITEIGRAICMRRRTRRSILRQAIMPKWSSRNCNDYSCNLAQHCQTL